MGTPLAPLDRSQSPHSGPIPNFQTAAPRTPVNRPSPEMRQASWAGNISVVLQPFLKWKRGMGKEKSNVSAAEENKAIFRRYAEEVGNQQNFELVDEIFERYISHQPDGSTLVRGPEDVKRFHREFHSAFSNFHIN